MVTPFLLRDVLDDAIPDGDTTLLTLARRRDDPHRDRDRRHRVGADLAVQRRRPARHARPARRRLPPPAAPVAGLLHAHADRRGAVAHRQRHRRRAERRHDDGDVDRLQRHDRARDASSRCSCSTGAWRSSASRCCRSSSGSRAASATSASGSRPRSQGRMADMSALVAESLSVSGILLGKTMGRSGELARALRGASPRSSPTSRCSRGWPAAGGCRAVADELRDHARARRTSSPGWRSPAARAITIGTVVAFTTLQTRLLLPIGSLLNVGVDMQTSRALFDRIFEYLDLPVDITERAGRGRRSTRRGVRGEVRFEDVRFRYEDDGAQTLRRRRPRRRARHDDGDRRRDRLGQDDARLPRRAPVRRHRRARRRSTASTCATCRFASLARDGRPRLAGDLPLPRDDRRQPALRAARGDRRGARRGGPRRADPRAHRLAARGLRHGRRRARLPLLRRREAAHRDRPHDPAQPAGARPRRGDERAGLRDRARRAGGARQPRRGPHDDRDRPPPVDGPRRRRDRRARRAAGSPSAARTTS